MTHHHAHDTDDAPERRPEDEVSDDAPQAEGPRGSDDTTQADAGMPGGTGAVPEDTAPEHAPAEREGEESDDELGEDIAEEVRRRRAQGQGRSARPAQGSEGAAGKIESGEW